MPCTSKNKSAAGSGSIRKKTVTRNGKKYTYWEGRFTTGYDPGTGKQIQRSVTGKNQSEVRKKMASATVEVDEGTFISPSKITLGEWLDTWLTDYTGMVKPRTLENYTMWINNRIKPGLGAVKLQALSSPDIQHFYNDLQKGKKPLSAKSIKNLHGVLHKALQQAVRLGYIRLNPSDACVLPRIEKAVIRPFDDKAIAKFLKAIQGHPYENLYLLALFTGMRESEILGLKWADVSFGNGTIYICRQLQRVNGEYRFQSPKSGKTRTLFPAPSVMDALRRERIRQAEWKLQAGAAWENDNELVFTNQVGRHLSAQTVYLYFKKLATSIGCPDARFHDLRHSYAIAALQSGDDIKTLQENLGHHAAAFTLDTYAHVTQTMKQESANRMESFILRVASS